MVANVKRLQRPPSASEIRIRIHFSCENDHGDRLAPAELLNQKKFLWNVCVLAFLPATENVAEEAVFRRLRGQVGHEMALGNESHVDLIMGIAARTTVEPKGESKSWAAANDKETKSCNELHIAS